MIALSPPFALVSPWPADANGKPAPIPIELRHVLAPETLALLEPFMATLQEVRDRLDEVKRLLGVEKDQATAKDEQIKDLEAKLAASPQQSAVDSLFAAVEELAAAVPDTVSDGTGTPPDTGTDSGSPTEPPTPPTGDQPSPLTSIGVDSPTPPDNGPDNATA